MVKIQQIKIRCMYVWSSPTHLGMMRRCKLTIWWRWATTNHVILCTESKLMQKEDFPFLFNHLQDLLKHGHFTRNLEHARLLEAELLFGFLEQNPKCLVAQVLGWDDKSLELLPNTNGKKPFRHDVVLMSSGNIWEGECSLEELDASAAIAAWSSRVGCDSWWWIGNGSVVVFRGIC